jgi:hypothetical protein
LTCHGFWGSGVADLERSKIRWLFTANIQKRTADFDFLIKLLAKVVVAR